jgi:maleate isomerase
MYGWRGRIGVIIPADNAVLEPDFHRLAPEGVSTHISRLFKAPRAEMPVLALRFAESLAHTQVDIVGYMCAASSFVLGPAGNERLCTDLREASSGRPSFTATTAMAAALQALAIRRVAVLSPHPPCVAEHLSAYLRNSGLVVSEAVALDMELSAINDAAPEEIYRAARPLARGDADGIFIAATNFRAIDVIEPLEADTGLPVVTSNQAAMWMALRLLGVPAERPGFGRLLAGGGAR